MSQKIKAQKLIKEPEPDTAAAWNSLTLLAWKAETMTGYHYLLSRKSPAPSAQRSRSSFPCEKLMFGEESRVVEV